MPTAPLKIRYYGDPCLHKKSIPVREVGPAERMLIASMIETMHEAKGIGLAAAQVGINQRIFVVDIGQGPVVIINPEIIRKSGSAVMEEGCLSIPGVTLNIKRAQKIAVKYWDANNRKVERIYEDLMARVIQHETDHLNGKLIVDHMSLLEKRKWKAKLKDILNLIR